jgi:hypothetical protein
VINLDALRYGDILPAWLLTSSSSTASSSDGIPTRPAGPTGSTTHPALPIGAGAFAACTKRSGRLRTGRSRAAATFTTLTAIRSTTPSTTSRASRMTSTSGCTLSNQACERGRQSIWRTLTLSGRWLPSGTDRLRVARGTSSMDAGRGPSASPSSAVASSAASRSCPLRDGIATGSAPTPASRHGGGRPGLTTKSAPVLRAAKLSAPIATQTRAAALASARGLFVAPRLQRTSSSTTSETFASLPVYPDAAGFARLHLSAPALSGRLFL